MVFQLLLKTNSEKQRLFPVFKLSDVLFVMVINVLKCQQFMTRVKSGNFGHQANSDSDYYFDYRNEKIN